MTMPSSGWRHAASTAHAIAAAALPAPTTMVRPRGGSGSAAATRRAGSAAAIAASNSSRNSAGPADIGNPASSMMRPRDLSGARALFLHQRIWPMRTVFLDKDSLPVEFRPPRCASPYLEYAQTAPEQVVERLADATIAIINKVPVRAAQLGRLPNLRLIALAATGYDCVDVGYCREHGIAVSNVRNYAMHT